MMGGSMCSGGGGLDRAAEILFPGLSWAWHCESDPHASAVLEAHWPDVPNHGDLKTTDWTQADPVDVVVAGFPCQDISSAGKQAGITRETRSGLWYWIVDALRVLRPRWVLLENVDRITTLAGALDVVLGELAEGGFDAEWGCLRASEVGAPHRRERWFCVAWPADAERVGGQVPDQRRLAAVQEPVGDGTSGRAGVTLLPTPTAQEPGGTVEQYHARLRAHDGRSSTFAPLGMAVQMLPTPRAHSLRSSRRSLTQDGHWSAPSLEQAVELAQGQLPREYESWGEVQGNQSTNWRDYSAAIARWEQVLGRPAPDPTVDGGKLSPWFVEWMMGWPDGHTDVGLSRNQRLKILGNGGVPLQAAYAWGSLLDRVAA